MDNYVEGRCDATAEVVSPMKDTSFRSKMELLAEYVVARKNIPTLNPEKVLAVLRTFLQLLSQVGESAYITESGRLFKAVFQGHRIDGSSTEATISEACEEMLKNICSDLSKSLTQSILMELLAIFNKALESKHFSDKHKLSIINAENATIQDKIKCGLRIGPESLAEEYYSLRRKIVLHSIGNDQVGLDVEGAYKLYDYYIRETTRVFIAKNKIVDGLRFLENELSNNVADNRATEMLVKNLILYNNLFFLESRETISELAERKDSQIGDENRKIIKEWLDFSPDKVEMKDVLIELVEHNLAEANAEDIHTIIMFTVPFVIEKPFITLETASGRFEFRTINNLYDDPIYSFLDQMDLIIGGMPLTIFSDAIPSVSSSTSITLIFNDFYHPDFELSNGEIQWRSFEEKDALLGRKYYPHKDRIVAELRALLDAQPESFPIIIGKADISINLIANYLVNYVSTDGRSLFHKVYCVTNLDTYLRVKKRYFDRISELNLTEDLPKIRELFLNTQITSPKSFGNYIYGLLDLIVKKSIEQRGISWYLWKEGKPVPEPKAQPMIKSHLQPILEAKGIQISREVVAANGALDFLCSYTRDGELFKVCIELKNAHHGEVTAGLTKQLPAYMKDEGTKDGIFLVLWYKSESFPEPAKFQTIEALKTFLEHLIPKNHRIKIMVIDCARPPTPSTL